jgi:hypothetical protein
MPSTLNRRERKAAQLLAHYATCEKLAIALGIPASKADGRKISIALWKLEKEAHRAAEHHCSCDTPFLVHLKGWEGKILNFNQSETAWKEFQQIISEELRIFVFGKLPPGFFVNRDPHGAALKIDPENKLGALLIADAGLHTDCGGCGILSPELNGD